MMEWISVKDRLPEYDVEVLMWSVCDLCEAKKEHDHRSIKNFFGISIGSYGEKDHVAYTWYESHPDQKPEYWHYLNCWSPTEPTHWMPLPEPPKKE